MHQWRDLKEPDLPEPSDPPISESRPAKSTSDDRKRAPEASPWSAALRAAAKVEVTKLDPNTKMVATDSLVFIEHH